MTETLPSFDDLKNETQYIKLENRCDFDMLSEDQKIIVVNNKDNTKISKNTKNKIKKNTDFSYFVLKADFGCDSCENNNDDKCKFCHLRKELYESCKRNADFDKKTLHSNVNKTEEGYDPMKALYNGYSDGYSDGIPHGGKKSRRKRQNRKTKRKRRRSNK
jgi:hypothetical protein